MSATCLALMSVFNTAEPGKITPQECMGIGADMAGRFSNIQPDPGIPNQFSIPIARLDVGLDFQGIGTRVRTSAVRSASQGSYIGVDGESILMRLDLAEVRWVETDWGLGIAAGLVQDAWSSTENSAWDFRALALSLGQQNDWMDGSDAGGTIVWTSPKSLVTIAAQMTSGEGSKARERNNGINAAGLITIRAPTPDDVNLEVTGFARDGSKGQMLARNHRFGGRINGAWKSLAAGASHLKALGVNGLILPEPSGTSAWFTVNSPQKVLGAARVDMTNWNGGDATSTALTLAVGTSLPVRAKDDAPGALMVGWKRRANSDNASGVAGAQIFEEANTLFLQLQFRGQKTVGFDQ